MPRLILLLAVIAVAYLLLRRVRALPPHKRRGEYIKLALGATVVVVIALTLTGRMHWVGAALTGLLVIMRQALPLLLRLFPMLSSLRGHGRAANDGDGAQQSTVQSALLRMHLDHDSGRMNGEVLAGKFQGWRLHDMDRTQLEELLEYCRAEDQDSAQLLDSYLQQRFPGEGPFSGGSRPDQNSRGTMNRAEALSILGLEEGAGEDEIVAAHRSLMQKFHPDRGGSDYLAAKINQAKDLLLE